MSDTVVDDGGRRRQKPTHRHRDIGLLLLLIAMPAVTTAGSSSIVLTEGSFDAPVWLVFKIHADGDLVRISGSFENFYAPASILSLLFTADGRQIAGQGALQEGSGAFVQLEMSAPDGTHRRVRVPSHNPADYPGMTASVGVVGHSGTLYGAILAAGRPNALHYTIEGGPGAVVESMTSGPESFLHFSDQFPSESAIHATVADHGVRVVRGGEVTKRVEGTLIGTFTEFHDPRLPTTFVNHLSARTDGETLTCPCDWHDLFDPRSGESREYGFHLESTAATAPGHGRVLLLGADVRVPP